MPSTDAVRIIQSGTVTMRLAHVLCGVALVLASSKVPCLGNLRQPIVVPPLAPTIPACTHVQMAEKEGQPSDIRSPYTSANTARIRAESDRALTAAPLQKEPPSTSGSEAAGSSGLAAVGAQNGRTAPLSPGAELSAGSAAQGLASGDVSQRHRGDATAATRPRPTVDGLSGSLRA